MAFLALVVGVVLIVAAIRNTQGTLLSGLQQDVPGFTIWGGALFAVAVVGFIPSLKPVSRGLLWLVLTVLILKNYKSILGSFQGAWQGAGTQAAPAPTQTTSGGSGLAFPQLQGLDFSSVLSQFDTAGSAAQVNG